MFIHSVNRLLQHILFIALLVISTYLPANAQLKHINVIISPEVAHKINQATPANRERLNKAIGTGNRYLKLRFNFEAYVDDENPNDSDKWEKTLSKLISVDQEKWHKTIVTGWKTVLYNTIDTLNDDFSDKYIITTCNNVIITNVSQNKNTITIAYETKIVGYFPVFNRFSLSNSDLSKQGQVYKITISIGNDSKIFNESSNIKYLAGSSNYVKWLLTHALIESKPCKDSTYDRPLEKKRVSAKLKKELSLLEQASKICK